MEAILWAVDLMFKIALLGLLIVVIRESKGTIKLAVQAACTVIRRKITKYLEKEVKKESATQNGNQPQTGNPN